MTAQYNMASDTVIANGINATLSGTTPSKGNIVDTTNFKYVSFAFLTGTVTDAGTASGFSVEIQESDDTTDGNFTAVADADLTQLESTLTVTDDTDDDVPVGVIGYLGQKLYVRAVVTGTTGTNAAVLGFWMLQGAKYSPPSSQIASDVAAT